MILDHISNRSFYAKTHPGIAKALEYLASFDVDKTPVGTYELDGRNVYVMVQHYDSKPVEQGKWEAHQKYIDVQFVARGREQMGYAATTAMAPKAPYDPAKDVVFLSGEGQFAEMSDGMFVILAPQDAHMPQIAWGASMPIKKVVVKVAV